MADESAPLLPRIIIGAIAIFAALTVLGWIIGAILNVLRLAALVAIVIAVIWAIGSARSNR